MRLFTARGLATLVSSRSVPRKRRPRLFVEALEDRQMPSALPLTPSALSLLAPSSTSATPAVSGSYTDPLTGVHLPPGGLGNTGPHTTDLDMTTVARKYAPHAGPTTIYLNFDGWTDYTEPLFKAE